MVVAHRNVVWQAVETAPAGNCGRHKTRLRGLGLLRSGALK